MNEYYRGLLMLLLSIIGHVCWLQLSNSVTVQPMIDGVRSQPQMIALVFASATKKAAKKVSSEPAKPKVVDKVAAKAKLVPIKRKIVEVALNVESAPIKAEVVDKVVPQAEIVPTKAEVVQKTTQVGSDPILKAPPVVKAAEFRQPPSNPVYPRLALRRKQQGEVLIRALVDTKGQTQKTVVVQSSGYISLDNSALAAVSNWHFAPAQVDGQAILAWVEVPVAFKLNRALR